MQHVERASWALIWRHSGQWTEYARPELQKALVLSITPISGVI